MKTTTIQVRIDPKTKREAGKIFADLGMDLSTGMKVYLNKVVETEGIPFAVTKKKFLSYSSKEEYGRQVAWALKHGKSYRSAKEMTDAILTEQD
ncbi:MAG: hypothetical protein A3C93_03310 [Candidatus Lloydbacteria bacterium RIFCSPHIGHO2_02_FULL_54_17]|uniref:Addiction module antitoxin, RelB/DinJ family n=1 Tax=Candidatus Lloydbacteria bacterium RIFCSPHIGHO2_02_FULL_54_17 TaxID=1798664 RepID=A0A1G2DF88_9BACT|nr:MAG: hypothetical protein A2762_04040 [Candidatus Lloydbacteria bacterium RIFCSPHIGHO2_01_FULL_54_11]OGZ12314.1 MAG: hypothetical protein A3C93_03310 [Candidatus Lloydbacteria bacterium RIFCSPHIGHO2_02_FULL_54_17]OGZ14592.1 MAG: hypothetical protein A2948_05810 [Candidatus Lloydbacteria bacterium RIFCSPLOWO2_01_FULL_54_18]OGZ16324.1 MAG: hypothetical protein A3H76_06570 [Candidatus Lloydbacteria bacterium RIFCSPLOWO2_02_FULL_54_12]